MTREELGLWLRLAAADGVGCLTATKLLQKFGLPEQIFAQSEQTLSALLKPAQVKALLQPGQELPTLIEATWSWLANTSGAWRTVVSLADSDYPRALLQLADPPVLLYATGSQAVYEHIAAKQTADDIAIVGSRNATPQGLAHARSFAKALAQSGLHTCWRARCAA
jgi:DNA processing protein